MNNASNENGKIAVTLDYERELAHVLLGLRLLQDLEGDPQDGHRLAAISEEDLQSILTDSEGLQGELMSIEWIEELIEKFKRPVADGTEQHSNASASRKVYAHDPDACPSNHWNDGNDTCEDCGKHLN